MTDVELSAASGANLTLWYILIIACVVIWWRRTHRKKR